MSKNRPSESRFTMNTVVTSVQAYKTNLMIIGTDRIIGTRKVRNVETTY